MTKTRTTPLKSMASFNMTGKIAEKRPCIPLSVWWSQKVSKRLQLAVFS
jgi:hypothetical protein